MTNTWRRWRIAFEDMKHDSYQMSQEHQKSVGFKDLGSNWFSQSVLKWGASSRWSIGLNSAWGSMKTTTIGKTHPTLFCKIVAYGLTIILWMGTKIGYQRLINNSNVDYDVIPSGSYSRDTNYPTILVFAIFRSRAPI